MQMILRRFVFVLLFIICDIRLPVFYESFSDESSYLFVLRVILGEYEHTHSVIM